MFDLNRCYRLEGVHIKGCECFGYRFSTLEKVLVVVAVLLLGSAIVSQIYIYGNNKGYAQGWSDANCGPGRDCEAGQF